MSGAAHLLVRAGTRLAAIPAAAVRRVVRDARLYPLPGAGASLVGLAEFAGEPLAVLDLARLLGEGRGNTRPPLTVVAWLGGSDDRELVGLGVDEALEVAEFDPATVAEGQALVGGRAVDVVDLDRLAGAR